MHLGSTGGHKPWTVYSVPCSDLDLPLPGLDPCYDKREQTLGKSACRILTSVYCTLKNERILAFWRRRSLILFTNIAPTKRRNNI